MSLFEVLMPVQVIWDNAEKTIIRQIYSGHLQVEDYYRATDEFVRLTQEISHTFHNINDRTLVQSSPSQMLNAMRYANERLPAHLGVSVVVKPTMFSRVLVNIGKRVAPKLMREVYFVETLAQAYALIAAKTGDKSAAHGTN
jgi:hypothetical protein